MAYDALNADQRAGTGPNGKPSLTIDQAAAQLTRAGLSWSAGLGQATTVTYAYRASAPATMPGDSGGFSQLLTSQISAVEDALRQWASVANITFVRVGSGFGYTADSFSDNATILFGNYSSGEANAAAFAVLPGNRAAASSTGDVWLNRNDPDNRYPSAGSVGFLTLLHEIGHAIGFLHPSDYDSEDGDVTYAANASYYEDSLEYSVMSYFDIEDTGGATTRVTPVGPLIDDIAAAQRLYGANMATNAGNTVYVSSYDINRSADYAAYIPASGTSSISATSDSPYGTIWDGGGIDTIDGSRTSGAVKIDLRAGSFSNFGASIGALSIAQGAVIENAIGGASNDTLIGNDVANVLAGGAGDDILIGGLGNDFLFGGPGNDTAVIAAALAVSSVGVLDSGIVQISSSDGADQLFGIEIARFTDRSLAVTNLIPIDGLYTNWGGRHAGSGELVYWADQMAAGVPIGTVRSTILADPLGRAHTDATVIGAYQQYFGRDPLADELNVWRNSIAGGADFMTLRNALVNDPNGRPAIDRQIGDVYQRMYARAPTMSELGVWETQFKAGADAGTIRTALLSDFAWGTFFRTHTNDLYSTFFGRSATYDESQVWRNLFYNNGVDFYTMGTALAADPSSAIPIRSLVSNVYHSFFGRAPGADETEVWKTELAHGATYASMSATLAADASARAYTIAEVPQEYQFFLGRDPTQDELVYWTNRRGAPGFSPVGELRQILFADPVAQARYPAIIGTLYQKYLQRAPTDGEVAYWKGGSDGVFEFANLTMKLIKGGPSATTQHAAGNAGVDRFAFDGSHIALDITGFTPGQDKIVLDRALLGGANPLDHAQTLGWDFRPDTLIQLDPTHAIVLQNVDIGQLTVNDFLFG